MYGIAKKILGLLSGSERRKLLLLIGAMIVSALIEVAGIASVLPFLSLLVNPDSISQNHFLNQVYTFFHFQDAHRFMIFSGSVFLVLLVISNSILALTLRGVLRFSCMRDYSISRRLFVSYLSQPYVFFLDRHSSEMAKNIHSEAAQVVNGVMIPVIYIISKGIIVLFIFVLLALVNPLLAVTVTSVFGILYAIIYGIVKHKLFRIGKRRLEANTARCKSLNETFDGIKQIKLLGCEDVCAERYADACSRYASYNASREVICQIPRYIIETVVFGGVTAGILCLLWINKGFVNYIPIFGLYVFAAYRLLPALQHVFSSITRVRFNSHALDVLYRDIHSLKDSSAVLRSRVSAIRPLAVDDRIDLKNVSFTYPGAKRPVIKNFNLSIKAHSSLALVGATGAGKTTVVDIILGLIKPREGQIIVDNTPVTDENIVRWQKNLGYIPQDVYLDDDTIAGNIAYGVSPSDRDKKMILRSAKIANIHDVVMGLPQQYDTPVGERGIRLSGGERQRIAIARALYHDPQVLILDEATNALDVTTEEAVLDAIENIARTKTLIIIAHRLSTVRFCDVICVLENGHITDTGTYEGLLRKNMNFRKMNKGVS